MISKLSVISEMVDLKSMSLFTVTEFPVVLAGFCGSLKKMLSVGSACQLTKTEERSYGMCLLICGIKEMLELFNQIVSTTRLFFLCYFYCQYSLQS